MELCKVRFDGHHYLVAPYVNTSSFSSEALVFFENEDLGINENVDKKSLFINSWAMENFPSTNKGRKKESEYLKKLHEELKRLYIILLGENNKITTEQMIDKLYNAITSDVEFIEMFRLDDYVQNEWLLGYLRKFVGNEKENLKGRKGRFRRKALNNDWNYFVTFTYDDNKHNEETFVKTLKTKLQNLHKRYDWLYMGCFERSKTERLHFHGLVYVPKGNMRGNIIEETYWDTNAHKKAKSFINDDFNEKIGRNDFKPITKTDLTFTHALDYILKYIGKSDNKIVYSRGIRDDFFALVDIEENTICKINENSPYYVLGDEEMITLDKNLKIADTNY